MSSSSAVGDSGKVSGQVSGQKLTFSQTCNLLSQYVNEKRAREGSVTYNRQTMNLFPVNGKPVEDSKGCIGRTINLFPQLSGFNSSLPKDHSSVKGNSCVSKPTSPEPLAPQMTIFYAGQVMVFNDLPADKVKAVMDLAGSFESSLKKRKVETTNLGPPNPIPIPIPNATSNPNPNPNPKPNLSSSPNPGNNIIPATVSVSDLPIARKASLHRFLEKRKDRLVGKVLPNADVSSGDSLKPVESKSWLGLGPLPVFKPL